MIETAHYNIYFDNVIALVKFLDSNNYSKYFIIVDEHTNQYVLPYFLQFYNFEESIVILIKAGESFKNLDTCKAIWAMMIREGADRKSLAINLGGGVIGDMGGFASSTFMRGIDFIQIPTTLLSMVDASIGGKLAIDYEQKKNLVGLFQDPTAVFIYSEFLKTLPFLELRSGFAEVLKHGLIRDKEYFESLLLLDLKNKKDWRKIISRSVQIKNEIVRKDPKEHNLRKILNFGHTIGHALESCFLKLAKPISHGEAVAAGMICESYIAINKLDLNQEEFTIIEEGISKTFPKIDISDLDLDIFSEFIKSDKKNEQNKILISTLSTIGTCEYNVEVDVDEIKDALIYYQN